MSLSPLTSKLSRLGRWLEKISARKFVSISFAIAILKIGVLGNGPEAIEWIRESATAFPKPNSWMSSSILQTLLFSILRNPSNTIWWAFSSLLWFVSLLIIGKFVVKESPLKRVMILLIFLSPAFSTTVSMIGKYDIYILLGIVITLRSRLLIATLVGALIASLANPELTLISSIAILGIVQLPNLKRYRMKAWILVSSSLFITIACTIWLRLNGIDSRLTAASDVQEEWIHAARSFLGYWPLAIYAGLGAMWLVVGTCLLQLKSRDLYWALTSCLILPAISSFLLTHDGTRVFAVISIAPCFLLIQSVFGNKAFNPEDIHLIISSLFIMLCVAPAVIIDASGGVRVPYEDFLNLLGWQGFWEQVPYDTIRNL